MNFQEIPAPCFVVDELKLRQNLEIIRQIRQKTGVHIVLALKGFATWSVFPILRDYLDGAAASSYYEARLCVDEMKTLAHTYSVAFNPDEFSRIMRLSSHISFNSLNQFEKYHPSVLGFKKHKISCGIRINPEFSVVKSTKNDPSQRGSRLGIDLAQLAAFEGELPIGIEGFHVHCLADSSAIDTINLLKTIEHKCAIFFNKIKWINLGGGHLFTENDYDLAYLIQHLNAFKNKYPHIQLIFEPSTAIGFNAGFLTANVLDIIDNQGIKTLMTNVSFKAHLMSNKDLELNASIRNAVSIDESEVNIDELGKAIKGRFLYRIGGITNDENDELNTYLFEKEMKIGDTLIFENALNYTLVKTTFFNGAKHPSIGILRENGVFEWIKRFNFNDYKTRLS
jgi:carboxynorspermidine decarboxylase